MKSNNVAFISLALFIGAMIYFRNKSKCACTIG